MPGCHPAPLAPTEVETGAATRPAPTSPAAPRPGRRAAWRALPRFTAATGGVVAIEVGLLGLPFVMLVLGIAAISVLTWCSSTLDFATQKAARQIMTGAAQTANISGDQFRSNTLCGYLPAAAFDCSKLVVNLKIVTESAEPTGWYGFVKSDASGLVSPPLNNASNSFCLGAGNTYQVLEVLYPFPILAKFVSTPAGLLANQFVVMSTAAFKNEPFQGGAGSQGSC